MAEVYAPPPKEETKAVRFAGLPWKVRDDEHAAEVVAAGGKPISESEAQQSQAAQNDLSYVDQNYGDAGKFGLGVASGLTLGTGPGALAQMGLMDPNHIQAAQASGLYTGGDVVGTLLPAILSGGESLGAKTAVGRIMAATPAGMLGKVGTLSERLAGSLIADSPGLMGSLAAAPIKMAARGATEGALLNMGHTWGDSMVQDKPLAATALWASGVDGALAGGLIGGTLGSVGSLGSMAVDSMGSLAGGVGKNAKIGAMASHLGADSGDLANWAANQEGVAGTLKRAGGILEEGGSRYGDSTAKMAVGAGNAKKIYEGVRAETVAELEAQAAVPDIMARVTKRFDAEIKAPQAHLPNQEQVFKFVDGVVDDLNHMQQAKVLKAEKPNLSKAEFESSQSGRPIHERTSFEEYNSTFREKDVSVPGKPASWEQWVKGRDQIASKYGSTAAGKEAVGIIDDEIRKAMEGSGVAGVAEKYGAATMNAKLASELEGLLGAKNAKKLLESKPSITPTDIGLAGVGALLGHPATSVAWLATKGISRKLSGMFEPTMAQMAYQSMIGTKAAGATLGMKTTVNDSVKRFFKSATMTPYKGAQVVKSEFKKGTGGYDRKSYEDMASKVEQLTSKNHQDKVRRYAEEVSNQGHPDLAQALMEVNNRAVQYATWAMPARHGTKNMVSLRPIPAPKDLTLQEHRAVRIMKGITQPLSILDDMEKGTLSRDTVQAAHYVYPPLIDHMAETIAKETADMKEQGKYLSMSKIMMLGIALDSQVDTIQSPEYIGAVQTALTATNQGQQQAQQPPPNQQILAPQNLMTPLQHTQNQGILG